ncbi:MAG: DUF4830 domain-containing protein [Ruminococcus sp.]
MHFVCTEKLKLKSSKKVRGALILGAVMLLVILCIWAFLRLSDVPHSAYSESLGEYSLSAGTSEEREEFFSQFGFEAECVYECETSVPQKGEGFESYNELQRSMGLDLRPFLGKRAQQYIFRLSQSEGDTPFYAVMLVYRDKVIAVHLTDFSASSDEAERLMPLELSGK